MFDPVQRRRFLTGIAGASAAGLAGCSSDGEQTTLSISNPGSGTSSAQSTSALQRAVQQEGKNITLRVQQTSGDPASLRQFASGDMKGYSAGLDIVRRAQDEREPFDQQPVENLAQQVLHLTSLQHYFVATSDSGVETFDDIVEMDVNVYLLPPSFGLRRLAEEVLQNAGVWEDIKPKIVNVGVGEVAGAIDEGRIDVALIYGTNNTDLAGWTDEVDARNDLHAVEATDTLRSGIEATSSTFVETIKTYGWEQDVGLDEVDSWPMPFHIYLGEDVPNDAVAELCRVSHEANDVVREADNTYPDHTNIENMTSMLSEDMPIHPGAQQFYEDNGANL